MPADAVYLLRHGDCRLDAIPRYHGQDDLPLNPAGQAQALLWQRLLATVPFSGAVCSDLTRCRETARIIALPHGLPIREHRALREIGLGTWEGRSHAEVQRLFPAIHARRGREIATCRPPGGESFADLAIRVVPGFMELLSHASGTLLVVAHAGVNRVIITNLMGMPLADLFRIGQSYGCLNLICRDPAGDYRVRATNLAPSDLMRK